MSETIQQFIESLETAFFRGDPRADTKSEELEHVRMIQACYRAVVERTFAAVGACLADNADFEIIGPPTSPFVGRWRGRDAVVRAVRDNFALIEERQPEVELVVAQGDTVVVQGRERGRFKPTGRTYAMRWVQIFQFDDGKLFSIRQLSDSTALLPAMLAG